MEAGFDVTDLDGVVTRLEVFSKFCCAGPQDRDTLRLAIEALRWAGQKIRNLEEEVSSLQYTYDYE